MRRSLKIIRSKCLICNNAYFNWLFISVICSQLMESSRGPICSIWTWTWLPRIGRRLRWRKCLWFLMRRFNLKSVNIFGFNYMNLGGMDVEVICTEWERHNSAPYRKKRETIWKIRLKVWRRAPNWPYKKNSRLTTLEQLRKKIRNWDLVMKRNMSDGSAKREFSVIKDKLVNIVLFNV